MSGIQTLPLMGATACLVAVGAVALPGDTAASEPESTRWESRARKRILQEILVDYLNLTSTQKAAAESIVKAAFEAAAPSLEQLQITREALLEAAKSGATASQIQQLAAVQARTVERLIILKTMTQAQLYTILEANQKAKLDRLLATIGGQLEERVEAAINEWLD